MGGVPLAHRKVQWEEKVRVPKPIWKCRDRARVREQDPTCPLVFMTVMSVMPVRVVQFMFRQSLQLHDRFVHMKGQAKPGLGKQVVRLGLAGT